MRKKTFGTKERRNIFIGIAAGLAVLFVWNIASFALNCGDISSRVLRLHVIANSDSDEDQRLKLAVRDEVLQKGSKIFDGSVTAQDAVEKITPQIDTLTDAAKQVLRKNGCGDDVKITVEKEYFDTRCYNDEVTLPAGQYMAVKVIIGSGEGKNWWCVMFPSLCLPAAEDKNEDAADVFFTDEEKEIVYNSDKYVFKFKLVEWYEKAKNKAGKFFTKGDNA